MYQRYGQLFLDNYFFYHVISRATQAIEEKGQPFFWYVTVMRVSMRIWFVAFIFALPYFIFKTFKKKKNYLLVTAWFLTVFLFFSAASSKIIWYIMPLYPAAAIMVGQFLSKLLKRMQKLLPFWHKSIAGFLILFLGTVLALLYLFYNRRLVYTPDLTGPQAELLQLKDKKFGVEQKVYVDRVELPLVLYYTDGPFNIIDYEPSKGRAPSQQYDQRIVLMTKEGRFVQTSFYEHPAEVVAREGDYVLFYYESELDLDKDRLEKVNEAIEKILRGEQVGTQSLQDLRNEQKQLREKISVVEELD
jgi:hypothetical protein